MIADLDAALSAAADADDPTDSPAAGNDGGEAG